MYIWVKNTRNRRNQMSKNVYAYKTTLDTFSNKKLFELLKIIKNVLFFNLS